MIISIIALAIACFAAGIMVGDLLHELKDAKKGAEYE